MEWLILILWLMIINGGLGGQYILNWMGNQKEFVGNKEVGVTAGIMTWWRELSKLIWALVAVSIEVARGKELKYLWPGAIAMVTIVICAFTGVIENIGFFYLPRYYSPHIFAPYVNVYLAFLPFFGKFLFNAEIRKEHWIGVFLVVAGLTIPHIPVLIGSHTDPKTILDLNAVIWIVIINCCLCSQQVLNNKTVQKTLFGVGPNALVMWREIWKMVFITSAIILFPILGNLLNVNMPEKLAVKDFETKVLVKLSTEKQDLLKAKYTKTNDEYVLNEKVTTLEEEQIKSAFSKAEYNRFFNLFEGSIIPNNWLPILFVVAAGLTGYIYSFGFFKLSKFAAHYWVPYTNVYLALLPFVMFLFGKDVTSYQIIGAVVTTGGLMVGVLDVSKNKVVEIEKK